MTSTSGEKITIGTITSGLNTLQDEFKGDFDNVQARINNVNDELDKYKEFNDEEVRKIKDEQEKMHREVYVFHDLDIKYIKEAAKKNEHVVSDLKNEVDRINRDLNKAANQLLIITIMTVVSFAGFIYLILKLFG